MTVQVVFFDLGETLTTQGRRWVQGAKALVEALRLKDYRLGIISNTTGLASRAEILNLLPVDFSLAAFESTLVLFSSEVGVEKPDPKIFRLAIDRAGLPAIDCLFCGENPNEITAAHTAGMLSYRVHSPPQSDFAQLEAWLDSQAMGAMAQKNGAQGDARAGGSNPSPRMVRAATTSGMATWFEKWNNPVGLAIIAACVSIITAVTTWFLDRSKEQLRQTEAERLEQKKLEGSLILDALKAGEGPQKESRVAANLWLLADAELIPLKGEPLDRIKKRAGQTGPGLPSAAPADSSSLRDQQAYWAMQGDAAYATAVLNQLFGKQFEPPLVEAPKTPGRILNAYYDGKVIYADSDVRYLPDITYHEVTHMYLPNWPFEGESGALLESICDAMASLVKQRLHRQTAATADWTIAPGAVAWLTGENVATTADKAPLRSLKMPGTAYDNKVLGKDPQVSHMDQYVKSTDDNGGVHTNCGIPNKAFYQASMKLGTEKAGKIWAKATLSVKSEQPTFQEFCKECAAQAHKLHGDKAREEVLAAWKAVGVEPAR